jgi:hypothetical protein
MYQNPTLFPQVTNRETWNPTIGIYDDDTGLAIDLTNITFQLEIRRIGPYRQFAGDGYAGYDQIGSYSDCGPILSATLGNGLTVIDTGIVQVFFTETQMRSLEPGTYAVSMTANDGTITRQIFVGRLPVFYGGVTT